MHAAAPELRRFAFGENWKSFLHLVDESRIAAAQKAICAMLPLRSWQGMRFLDAGCGSGLHSLAARRLGAFVHSFDVDENSVECTRALRARYHENEQNWTIERGSLLDGARMQSLGQFDIVYCWGVAHHTGAMHQALANLCPSVKPGGFLYLGIYNDQGLPSRIWKKVKKLYCSGRLGKYLVLAAGIPYFIVKGFLADLAHGRNPFLRSRHSPPGRGMSPIHDWVDWLGGYPFEVARPEEIFDFYQTRAFTLVRLTTCRGGMGNNEFVFQRRTPLPGE